LLTAGSTRLVWPESEARGGDGSSETSTVRGFAHGRDGRGASRGLNLVLGIDPRHQRAIGLRYSPTRSHLLEAEWRWKNCRCGEAAGREPEIRHAPRNGKCRWPGAPCRMPQYSRTVCGRARVGAKPASVDAGWAKTQLIEPGQTVRDEALPPPGHRGCSAGGERYGGCFVPPTTVSGLWDKRCGTNSAAFPTLPNFRTLQEEPRKDSN